MNFPCIDGDIEAYWEELLGAGGAVAVLHDGHLVVGGQRLLEDEHVVRVEQDVLDGGPLLDPEDADLVVDVAQHLSLRTD